MPTQSRQLAAIMFTDIVRVYGGERNELGVCIGTEQVSDPRWQEMLDKVGFESIAKQ